MAFFVLEQTPAAIAEAIKLLVILGVSLWISLPMTVCLLVLIPLFLIHSYYLQKKPGEPDITWADISKIKKILSWQPKVSFEEGIKKVLYNIDSWKEAPVWTPENIEKATQDWFKYLS